tara:strand:- start:1662 stop:2216 length:555 start_codon:yes stop_codon:yes gene_type:complete
MSALQALPSNLSYLSPIGFKFQLSKFPEVNYFCQSANIPGISIGQIELPTPTSTGYMAGDEVAFEELTISFVIDENMKNWLSIYDWIIALGVPTMGDRKALSKLQSEGAERTSAVLTVLTGAMNAQLNFYFNEVWPLNLSSIEFNSTSTEVDYVTANVSFRYDNYRVENLLNNESSFEGTRQQN